MERIRPRRKPMADINVVPYIDVMLVLLIVFMVTAPLLVQGINVDLPDEDTAPIPQDEEPIIVSVNQQGEYFINIGGDSKSPVTLEQIQERVGKVLKQKPGTSVLVEGDQNVLYGKVIYLMSALQKAGTPNLGLVTEPPQERG